jgi:signal transduction histidine kinase
MQFVHPIRLTRAAESSDSFHQDMLRGFTHKLNNLLGVIQGFSSLALMDEGVSKATTEGLEHIQEAATDVLKLGERVRSAGGCAKPQLQALDLGNYFRLMQAALAAPFAKAKVPFEVELETNLPSIQVDPTRFREVLLEVLTNAAEAAQAHGGGVVLKVTEVPGEAAPSQQRVELLVCNTGTALPGGPLERIFDPFQSGKTGHVGLGLTIAAMLCLQMNLEIGLASEAGQTQVRLRCPVA